MSIRLSQQIIEPLQVLVSPTRLKGIEDIIVTSGRAGTKSSAVAINTDYRALASPSAHIMMRKNHNKLRQTVFTESKRAFSRLGIRSSQIETRTSPFNIRVKKNNSVIYFTGSDNPDDTKGLIDDNFPIETVTIDEVNEFFKMGYERGREEIENIKATFIRGNTADDFKMFYMFNPPKNPYAPVMKWLESKKYLYDDDGNVIGENPRTLHIHVTYKDAPVEWLGKALIESAKATKEADEEFYRWLWLGESIGIKDVIYHMFNDTHIIDYQGQHLDMLSVGVDYGQMNATVFDAFGLDKQEKRIQGVRSYHHSGRDTSQKTPVEYANDLYDFINEVEELTQSKVMQVVIDPSAKGFAEQVRSVFKDYGKPIRLVSANNKVDLGIDRTQALLTFGALVIDSSMTHVIDEFRTYRYQENQIDKGREIPLKENDHHMDAIRYMVMALWRHVKRMRKGMEELDDTE